MGSIMNLPRHPTPLAGEGMGGVGAVDLEEVLGGAGGPRDGRNVVFHEFAHQLDFEDGRAGGVPVLPADSYQRWGAIMRAAMDHLQQCVNDGVASALDPYGATNPPEFLPRPTEAFFERPAHVRAETPPLDEALRACSGQAPGRA